MSKSPSAQEIFSVVRACLARSLALSENEITPTSRLIDELGVDSLDFADIVFSLEKSFSVKLRSAELDSLLRVEVDESGLVEGKYIAREEADAMREWLPLLESAPDPEKITPHRLFSFVTAESLVILLQKKLGER